MVQTRMPRWRSMAVCRQADQLAQLWDGLPSEGTDYKLVSFGGLAAIGLVRYVAERAVIHRLSVSTFRVGPGALKTLCGLYAQGQLEQARFIIGNIQARDQRKTSAIEQFEALTMACRRNGWELAVRANHTKLALFDTSQGRFVLEGSSNLNEAPNWEQFSLTRDGELYEFYQRAMDLMFASPAPIGAVEAPEEPTAADGLEWREGGDLEWGARDSPLTW